MELYTKSGRPLQVDGEYVYSKSGQPVGRITGKWVLSPNGRYVGTIEDDTLVYRSVDSAELGGSFTMARRSATALANRAASAIWGEEPDIPD